MPDHARFLSLQSVPLSALDLGLETEATAAVKQEPEAVSTPAVLNVRVRTGIFRVLYAYNRKVYS